MRVWPGAERSIGLRRLWVLAVLLCPGCAPLDPGVERVSPAPVVPDGIEVMSPLLGKRMAHLAERSRIWRAGMDSLAASGFRVVVAEPEQARERVAGLGAYTPEHVGEVLAVWDEQGRIVGAVVTVDVAKLRELYELTDLSEETFLADVDRILIHEIYGHVVPLAASRQISGGCPDPAPGEPALASCAIERENAIRAELGLEPRTVYDLRGLAVGRALASGATRDRRPAGH